MNSEHVEVLRHMKETIKAIMPSEVAAIDAAIASLSTPQPEGEWVLVPRELLEAAVCPMKESGCDGTQYPVEPHGEGEQCQWCYERRASLSAHPPPSAPVGVELPEGFETNLSVAEATLRKLVAMCPVTPPEAAAIRSVIVGARALAQQPAAVDEAMVDRAMDAAMEIKHNKETWFPMTRRRMKRALKAALAAQQPAAVDEAMELLDEAYGELAADSYRDGPRSLLLTRMEAALAAQQGGSDNDR